jgi:ABC-type phosphate transport system substrate-binding protein
MKRSVVVLALVVLVSVMVSAQVAVIANPSVKEYTIDRDAVVKFYTLANAKWSDGSVATVFDLKQDHPVRAKMLDFISKEPLELRRMWLKAVASGAAKAPEVAVTEEEVVEKVASTPGAVGYVSTAKVGKGVKVLMRFGK